VKIKNCSANQTRSRGKQHSRRRAATAGEAVPNGARVVL